jgi:hypothetical protein
MIRRTITRAVYHLAAFEQEIRRMIRPITARILARIAPDIDAEIAAAEARAVAAEARATVAEARAVAAEARAAAAEARVKAPSPSPSPSSKVKAAALARAKPAPDAAAVAAIDPAKIDAAAKADRALRDMAADLRRPPPPTRGEKADARRAGRAEEVRAVRGIACPTCHAEPGAECNMQGAPGIAHAERWEASKARRAEYRRRLDLKCQTCGADPGDPCAGARPGQLHTART